MVAAGVTVVLWASAFVAIRSAGAHYAPGALALGRLLAGTVVLAVMLVIRREGLPPLKACSSRAELARQRSQSARKCKLSLHFARLNPAWPGIVASGVLWFGVYMAALNWGEQLVDAGTAAMVVNVGPIIIALLSGLLLGEGFPPRLLIGMAVSFAGAIVVGMSISDGRVGSVLGVVLCLVSALTYSAGVVAQKPALRHASALQVTTFGCAIGALACLPFAGQLVDQVAKAPWQATANMVYLGVFPTALAFTTWAYALARTTAGKMGATTYVVPAMVVVMSWLLLDEIPGWLTLVGGAVCLAGVAVSRSKPHPSRAKSRSVGQ